MKKSYITLILAINHINLQAWNPIAIIKTATKAVDTVKDAANTVNKGLQKAGDAIKDAANVVGDRFKDTKITRSVDYAARKAAFEASLVVATGVLETARHLSTGSLDVAEKTAKLAVQAAQGFVSEVGRPISDAVLIGSSQAAKGVLEGAKQTTLGVLQGTQWVVNNTLGQIDINCIHYDGSLQELKSLNLGNVRVQGKIIASFDKPMSLDLSNPISTVTSFATEVLAAMMKDVFIKPETAKIAQQAKMPIEEAIQKIDNGFAQAALVQKEISSLQTPTEIIEANKAFFDAQKQFEEAEKNLQSLENQAKEAIIAAAAKGYDELIKYVTEHGSKTNRQTILYRQELFRRRQDIHNLAKQYTQEKAKKPDQFNMEST